MACIQQFILETSRRRKPSLEMKVPMKNITTLLALTFGLSAFTVLGRPVPGAPEHPTERPPAYRPQWQGGRAAETFKDARPSPMMRREARNERPREAQNLREPRGQQGPQGQFQGQFAPGPRNFGPGGNQAFGPGVGPMRRGFGGPPMMNQPRQGGRQQFAPPMNRGQGRPNMGPGNNPMRRGFGGPPMMNGRGPMVQRDFTPPSRGQGGPGVGPMRRGFGSPPMMNQPRQGGRQQLAPPMNRGQGRPNMGPGNNPMRRGNGSPNEKDQRSGPPQGTPERNRN